MVTVALFSSSPSLPTLSLVPNNLFPKPYTTTFPPRRSLSLLLRSSTDNGPGVVRSTTVEEKNKEEEASSSPQSIDEKKEEVEEKALESNGAATMAEAPIFRDTRWVGGTWDLKQFQKSGRTDWDAVIDAEVRRRKWFEDNPESTSNDDTIIFDISIIPWSAWMQRFHLPEAELLNGRAAMVGFFMAYLVDGLTGLGLVDQMGNFICKILMFVAVVGVLLIQKNEDVGNLKKLLEETTFYDKQWQATWQEDTSTASKKE